MGVGKYSPTVSQAYAANQDWFNQWSKGEVYDPEGYDTYGYDANGKDREGHTEDEYAAGNGMLDDRVYHKWTSERIRAGLERAALLQQQSANPGKDTAERPLRLSGRPSDLFSPKRVYVTEQFDEKAVTVRLEMHEDDEFWADMVVTEKRLRAWLGAIEDAKAAAAAERKHARSIKP
jgi:hypothetical protein